MKMPAVTAVVPYYNMSAFVQETVDCLLEQTWTALDVIIVNDGSSFEHSAALKRFETNPRIRIITKENEGVSVARNTGITAATGKYILALDADDLLEKTFAEKAVKILEADENVGLVESRGRYFGDRKGLMKRQPLTMENIVKGVCHCGYGMFRKTDWKAAGGYDSALVTHEDLDFWMSIIELGKRIYRIDEALYSYRRHADSAMSRHKKNIDLHKQRLALLRNKHAALYAEYLADTIEEEHCNKIFLPRFLQIKKLKYKLILFIARLPILHVILRKSVRKTEFKLQRVSVLGDYGINASVNRATKGLFRR